MSDMLVVYPSSLGYKSYRNTVNGSWLISKLVPVFLEHACHEHIAELLTRVNREVSQMETSGRDVPPGNVAQPEAHWALCKLLYFFPGK
ncbi:hypothetical protein LSAT2_009419 [Lamellibrachia satsuma]|nr:hypothetical protein LSAT2_009419 [Lamellibrachia satsuma]